MYNLFAFAIGARLVAFIVFVACVYAGNLLFCQTGTTTNQVLVENYLCDSLLRFFLLLLTYVVWFVFYFGLNA